MTKETNKYSANAQSNGWTFEYVAALVVYLENMNNAISFCVEGTDDIVVFLKDGKIAVQAKCGCEQDSIIANHFTEIIESIRTLSQNGDATELIAVSNYHAPLGKDDSFSFTQILDKKSFKTLSLKSKEKIKEKCNQLNYVIEFDKLKFWFIRFEGDNPELGLEQFLKDKLIPISLSSEYSSRDLMNQWLQIIQSNGRTRKDNISTDIMCGTLFGKILSYTSLEKITKLINEEVDPCYEDVFYSFFNDYFSKQSQNFRIYSDIVSEYFRYVNDKKPSSRMKYKEFVDYYCCKNTLPSEITNAFKGFSDGQQLANSLHRLFVAYVCYKKDVINSIREAFGYADN